MTDGTTGTRLVVAAAVLASAGAAANGGQQSELVIYASGRFGSGSALLDAVIVLAALVLATGVGLLFTRRWPVLLLATAPLNLVLLVAGLDPPGVGQGLRIVLTALATLTRVMTVLGVLGAAQDLIRREETTAGSIVAGIGIGAYGLGGYLQGMTSVSLWLLGVSLLGGAIAGVVRRTDLSASTADRRAAAVGTIAALLALMTALLPAVSPQETLGLTGTTFALAALVLGGLLGLESLGWLIALTLVSVGIGWPMLLLLSTSGGPGWLVVGIAAGAAVSLVQARVLVAVALCLVTAVVAGLVDGVPEGPALAVVVATLVVAVASAAPTLTKRAALPAVLGPLLAVGVTACSELALWTQVTLTGQTAGVVFGSGGSYTVPVLVAAALVIGVLGAVELRRTRALSEV